MVELESFVSSLVESFHCLTLGTRITKLDYRQSPNVSAQYIDYTIPTGGDEIYNVDISLLQL